MGNDTLNNTDEDGGFAGMSVLNSAITGAAGGFIIGGTAALITGHSDQAWKWGPHIGAVFDRQHSGK